MGIGRILIALDFSETAAAAATWAVEYFAPGAQAVLLHVIDPPHRPAFAADRLPSEAALEAIAREYATRRMKELTTSLKSPVALSEIRVGKPHEQIVSMAIDIGADLVVIGPHGIRPRPSRFLGTTADRVVRTSSVPVLVATSPAAHPPRRLLVPVDDASITPALLAWARDLAERFDGDITLLHVWSNADYSHVASMSYATTRNEVDARREIEKDLHDAAAYWLNEMARTGIARDRVMATVAYGDAGDRTIETATATKADLIVLGRRGSGLVAPALLGSTVGTVLHGARCPVLVIPGPPEAEH